MLFRSTYRRAVPKKLLAWTALTVALALAALPGVADSEAVPAAPALAEDAFRDLTVGYAQVAGVVSAGRPRTCMPLLSTDSGANQRESEKARAAAARGRGFRGRRDGARCARAASSGTTPPNFRWTVSCDETTLERTAPLTSRSEADVSSHEDSIPSKGPEIPLL